MLSKLLMQFKQNKKPSYR